MSGLRSRDEFLAHGVMPSHPMPETDCSICTELLEADVIKIIRCSHAFHTVCALSWFRGNKKGNRSCPNCRAELYEATPQPILRPVFPRVALDGSVSTSQEALQRVLALTSTATRALRRNAHPQGYSVPPIDSNEEDLPSSPARTSPFPGSALSGLHFAPPSSSRGLFDTPAGNSRDMLDTPAVSSQDLFDPPPRSFSERFGVLENRATQSAQRVPDLLFGDMAPSSAPHDTRIRRTQHLEPVPVSAATRLAERRATSAVPTPPFQLPTTHRPHESQAPPASTPAPPAPTDFAELDSHSAATPEHATNPRGLFESREIAIRAVRLLTLEHIQRRPCRPSLTSPLQEWTSWKAHIANLWAHMAELRNNGAYWRTLQREDLEWHR